MSYKALLFCPDERTAKVVTQVLSELEFQVEACNEPFAAVKKLMAGHFDAVVVDCDNEQNATLLFKSARNSEFNQASLSVAVVEGQSGVAKAFRIGANLVLTKPINVEQSKGTLRVARGLLRKNEAAKTSGKALETLARSAIAPPSIAPSSLVSASHPVSVPLAPISKPAFVTTPAPSYAPAASSSSAFELEKDPTPKPEPAEAAFLESVSDQADTIRPHDQPTPATKQYPWQAVPKSAAQPMAESMTTALKHAAEATGRPDSGIGVGYGAAAAPARAKELAGIDDEISALEDPAQHPGAASVAMTPSAEAPANWARRIAAIILVAAASGAIYRAGTQTHWQMSAVSSLLHQAGAALTSQIAKPLASTPVAVAPAPRAAMTSAPVQSGATSVPQISTQNSTTAALTLQKPSPATETIVIASSPKRSAVNATSFDPPTPPGVVKEIGEGTVFVDTKTPRPVVSKPAPVETVEAAAPEAVSAGSQSNDSAISGLMSMPSSVPQPGPETLKVSQGVSQGLLVKKVAPVYPARAMQAHLQGAVLLLATISKDGDITAVKLLKGEPVLARAAMDAVKQWKYKPYLLDSQPMEIQTQITVNFTLP
jgi:periplasmic protein TonB